MSVIEKFLASGLFFVLMLVIFNAITFFNIASALNSVLMRAIATI